MYAVLFICRGLSSLQTVVQTLDNLSSQLQDNLTYILQKLQLPDLLTGSNSSSSSSPATPAAGIDPLALEPQLRKETSRLCGDLTAAADAVGDAHGVLERLATAQNPYLSGKFYDLN